MPTLHPRAGALPLSLFGPGEIDALRLLLKGSSVVDWTRLHYDEMRQIDAFLQVNEVDPIGDDERLRDLHARSLDYLGGHLRYKRIPESVVMVNDIRTLFLMASGHARRREKMFACMLLKVMHILHYLEAHELLSRLPISLAEISVLVRAKVERFVRGLLERKFPIIDFAGNTKSNDSILSKLLAKKDSQAAKVFDKLRFRLVVERNEDIPSLILAMMDEITPYNYIIPNQSDNSLLDLDTLLFRAGNMTSIRAQQNDLSVELNEPAEEQFLNQRKNEFSGPSYKVVSFVAEVPIRIDSIMSLQQRVLMRLGRVVFGNVEFQIVDRNRAQENDRGENRHALYKARQQERVKLRLEHGRKREELLGSKQKSRLSDFQRHKKSD